VILEGPSGLNDDSDKSDLSEDDEETFDNEDNATESEDEGDEEYDVSEEERDPGFDEANDEGAIDLEDQPCPVDADDEEKIVEERYPHAGQVHGKTNSPFQNVLNTILQGKGSIYHPFKSEEELELATWMHQSGLPMSKIDHFLKLKYVSVIIGVLH
jgi:hypothetical protein